MRAPAAAVVPGIAAVAAAVVLGIAAPAAADPADPRLSVSDVRVAPGRVSFLLTGVDLPAGAGLDAGDVRVDVDGETLPATVTPTVMPTVPPTGGTAAPAPPRAVVLVLDASGSMAGARLSGARTAATEYADGLPADVELGLVAVADRPTDLVAPTLDRAAFRAGLSRVVAKGGTALYDGIDDAQALLAAAGPTSVRRIVVLSDGADTSSRRSAAAVRADLGGGTTLDAVAFGPDAGGAALRGLASGTGGQVVSAADTGALRSAFASIAARLPSTVTVQVAVPARYAGRAVTVHATLALAGYPDVGTGAPVTTRPDPSVPALAPVRLAARPGWTLYAGLAGIGCALLLGVPLLVLQIGARARVRRMVRQAAGATVTEHARGDGAMLRAALSASEYAIERRDSRARIEVELDRAGINLRPAEWILMRCGAALLGGVLLAMLLPWLLGLLLGVPLGWAGAGAYRRMRATSRTRRFADQLPDALQLVVGALRSGFSFPQAIAALVADGGDVVSAEFGRALAEIRLGGDLEEALLRTAERTGSEDLSWLVMAIRVQREVGGALSEVLETAVETMRERGRLRRHVRGLSAEGRLSAWVLAGMPVLLAAFMFAVRRQYLHPLYTTPLGILMLVVAVLLMAVGTFWITRVVRVEV